MSAKFKVSINIAYVMPSSAMYGDNIALLNIMPKLVEFGVNPLFVVPSEGALTERLKLLGFSYVIAPLFSPNTWVGYSNKLLGVLFFLRRFLGRKIIHSAEEKALMNVLCSFKPHIIHTNNTSSNLGYELSKKIKVPHIWHIREYGDYLWDYFPDTKSFINKVQCNRNYAIAITTRIKDHFHFKDNCITIYDGVFKKGIYPSIIMPKDNYFLFVGRLVEIKGVDMILRAFSSVKDKLEGYRLIFLGDTDDTRYGEYLQNLTVELGIKEQVFFYGYCNNVSDYMQKATALISACKHEAFGFTIAEAMLNGCPVIGIDSCGTAQQFDNIEDRLKNYIALRFCNVEELSRCMSTIAERSMDISLLDNVQKEVNHLYSVEESAESVFNFYKKILKETYG